MAFDLVTGHETPKVRLMEALLGDRLAHAYLFHGSPGTGAETLAIELAKAINCDRGPGEPCQQCKSCRTVSNLQHPDVHVYLPSTSAVQEVRLERRKELTAQAAGNPYAAISYRKSDYLSIADIRELRQVVTGKPYEGRRKVVLLFAADRMNTEASNALLKTLEEPPGNLLLLLVTDRIHRLLPTILSRCQPVHLARLPDDTLHDMLIHRFQIEPGLAALAVRQADGSVGNALLSVSEEGESNRTTAFEFLETVHDGSLVDVFEKVEQLVAVHKTRPILENMLDLLLGYYRDLFLLIETGNGDAIQHVEKTDWLNRTAQKLSFDKVQSAISAIEEIKKNILQNAQVQLAMTVLALRLRAVGTVAKQVTTPGSTS